jgi:Tfp pilus assembly protein FimT
MKNGFTLLEITISIGILVLVGTLALASFVSSRNIRNLNNSGGEILTILRQAQARSLAGENNSSWGVHVDATSFVLFRGSSFAGATTTESFSLPANLEIANINLTGGGSDIVFKRLDGRTDQSGSFDLRVKGVGGYVFSVSIDLSGKVYQTGSSPAPTGTRAVDTRHRTFALNGTVKNFITMTLTFSDPPNPDTIYSVVMSPLPPRTSFDWSGTVAVGGQNQTLRIHALSISDTATLLSVDRDCRKNTKQVKISFDTNDVATYNSNCQAITIWPFGGTASEP